MKIVHALAALASLLALAGTAAPAVAAAKKNWTAHVTLGEDGSHTLGNPEAGVKVDEFVSYTCSHCATFQKEAEAPMRLAYVMPGKVSVRVVHLIRDPVDLAAALLTNCGDPKGFFARHHTFMATQEKWLSKVRTASPAQRARWTGGDVPSRMRAIASDLDFYTLMAPRGFGTAAVNRCLGDAEMARKITAQRGQADRLGVPGTPSFAIGGELLDSVHDWKSLGAAIDALL